MPMQIPAESLSRDLVSIRQVGAVWRICAPRSELRLDVETLAIALDAHGHTWALRPSEPGELVVESNGARHELALRDAQQRDITPYDTGCRAGVVLRLRDFPKMGNLCLRLFVTLDVMRSEAVLEVVAEEDGVVVKQLHWPGAVEAGGFDASVLPFMQGAYLPARWPKAVRIDDDSPHSRGLYMPVWGHLQGGAALAAIIETPADAGLRFTHPAGGPTRVEVRWLHSLGRLRYPRRLRLCPLERGGHVGVAKRYRRWAQESNLFVSLTEKVARNPLVAQLVGAPVVHTHILYHVQPTSDYYAKVEPRKRHDLVSFHERAEHLRRLAARGLRRAYVHLDGWGARGYDNLHPDILPPCPEAGGWDGLRHLSEVCEELNFVFALHDQYRDYYEDAASYDIRHAVVDEHGQTPGHRIWYGGPQKILCPRLAPEFVERNYAALDAHAVRVRGAYLDVFAVVPPDECYNPEHPVTREECLRHRAECFTLIRRRGGVISSEEPVDWAIPYLDLVHHGPYSLDPTWDKGTAKGLAVPFFNLVHHDALLVPWMPRREAWGIPQEDDGLLHALLNGGMPYVDIEPDAEEQRRVRTVCALHQRVALAELTGHEFLDEAGRRQRTEFGDGTRVTADFDRGTFEIEPPLTAPEFAAAWA